MKFYPVFVLNDGRVLRLNPQASEQDALRVIDGAFDMDRFFFQGKTFQMVLVDRCFIHTVK